MIAATENDAYNTLVLTDYAFDFGRQNVFQIAPAPRKLGIAAEAAFQLGGRPLQASQSTLTDFTRGGSEIGFSATKLTAKFDLKQLIASKDARWVPVLAIKPDLSIAVATADKPFTASTDDIVIGH